MEKIKTLKQFYSVMNQTKKVRKKIVTLYFEKQKISENLISILDSILSSLLNIPQTNTIYQLALSNDKTIDLDLSYEIGELKKDLLFLKTNEDNFYTHLSQLHENFEKHVKDGEEKLKNTPFKTFISDRDGTINNYCGRYSSSIQSIYNAVFLGRFSQSKVENAIILTSAPLMNIGLADISVAPDRYFIYSGSKGREYIDKKGKNGHFPIEEEQQKKLTSLNAEIKTLIEQEKYERYSLIGSGLQFKFGQTTIARQDISKTIPPEESKSFLKLITKMVSAIDPENRYFRIEDTGLDIEIILTIESEKNNKLKDFDKGDGIHFLNKDLHLNMEEGACLICGDTNSDVPMISAAAEKTKETTAIFVTRKNELIEKVKNVSQNYIFIPEPDMLVAILNNISKL